VQAEKEVEAEELPPCAEEGGGSSITFIDAER
jgi:hypothetical protein